MQARHATLELERTQDWLTVWLNRPGSRNALDTAMTAELRAVFDEVAADAAIRGVTLRGRGGVFCAGGDLRAFRAMAVDDAASLDTAIAHNLEAGQLFERINTLPQVVVVLVEGAAMAGGLGMACCADLVAVTRQAQFALTETTLGIPPAQIAPIVAGRLGLATARRLMLTAARFTGDEARTVGLADFVAADVAELERIETDLRTQVRRCAPGANAATKAILLASRTLQGDGLRQFAAESFARALRGPEGREGLQAFLDKRPPCWAAAPEGAQP
ncbi:MAG TPA: enoyl-CoA hydratase-related protein [Steroidobacteraceae bacterium]|nr:enoyl-CoA hydratase-related protein [Steroidobacteraceae bacterium]